MPILTNPNDIPFDDLFHLNSRGAWVLKSDFPALSDHTTRALVANPIFEYKGFAIKYFVEPREIEMAELAGDCGVKVHGHVVRFDVPPDNQPRQVGLVMEAARPLVDYIKTIQDESEKHRIKEEMIAVLEELHTKYKMIHGDVKLLNFLICNDGRIRLCDFENARPVDEDAEIWERLCCESIIPNSTERYNNKTRNHYVPPTEDDDWYALAISVWELYTGKVPFDTLCEREELRLHHRTGQTVDLAEVTDDSTREWIRGILRKGGALV